MNDSYNNAKQILMNNNQEHIIPIMETLNENKKEALVEQILQIDFNEIENLYKKTKQIENKELSNIERLNAVDCNNLPEKERQEYMQIGRNVIQKKEYAVAIMAGGQGSRLGYEGPKGTYKLDIGSEGKYLFEILIDKLKRAKKRYGVYIPCYIMTSKDNNEDTIHFFEKMKFFGYPKKYVRFFKQNSKLVLNDNGKIIIGEDYLIKSSSNGNGEIFTSMREQGIVEELKKDGIKWLFICGVDNILVHLVDTMLLGLTIKNNEEIGTRTILKNNPEERVGVFCKQNGKVKVIEYTEIPKETARAVDEKGNLLYGEANTTSSLFSIEALEKVSTTELEYHVAHKKMTYLDEDGILVRPEKPNCYKFERFIFDAFRLFDSIAILRDKRETSFAPIKNAEGTDSPKTAKKMYEDYQEMLKLSSTKKVLKYDN